MALHALLRPHFKTHQGYSSAGMESDKSANRIFLNANENPYELPDLAGMNRYPEPQPLALREAYAGLYGVEPGQIAATRGADEAISVLIKLFCEPHQDSILISSPTFGVYAIDAGALPCGVVDVPLKHSDGDFTLDYEGICAALSDVKLVFLCSPNNPTGTSFAADMLQDICRQALGHAAVVVDETYIEFSENDSLAGVMAEHPNLIVLRTLSKSYALASARMGCMMTQDKDFIQTVIAKGLDVYPIPRPSTEAALKAIAQKDLAHQNIQKILKARDEMIPRLRAQPLVSHIYPSDANFVLLKMKNAAEFCTFAAEKGVYIRDFSAKTETKGCIRLSIGTPYENELVLNLLDEFANSQS